MKILHKVLGNAEETTVPKILEETGIPVEEMLIPGESVDKAFKFFRDFMLFTSKRLLLVDRQNLSGKKIEMLTIPWDAVTAFAVETAGTLDLDAELKITVKGFSYPIVKRLAKGINIMELQLLLAKYVLPK